jgi:cytochrome c oxidase subunit 2
MASAESPVSSPVTPPAPGWSTKLPRDERVFTWLILVVGVLMAAFSIGWLYFGDQNVPTTSETTTTEAWSKKVAAWAGTHTDARGRAVVPPGEDGYVQAFRYGFYPETIVIKAGQPTTLWISSVDVLHGYSITGGGQNLNLEIAPRHAFAATFTPDKPGTYLVVCNEYCGLQHHQMKGRIVVEE